MAWQRVEFRMPRPKVVKLRAALNGARTTGLLEGVCDTGTASTACSRRRAAEVARGSFPSR
jgi:hypothetical protein